MVFESIVADILNRYLGEYVENLDKGQLKIGIWGGEAAGAFDVFDFSYHSGKVRSGENENIDFSLHPHCVVHCLRFHAAPLSGNYVMTNRYNLRSPIANKLN